MPKYFMVFMMFAKLVCTCSFVNIKKEDVGEENLRNEGEVKV